MTSVSYTHLDVYKRQVAGQPVFVAGSVGPTGKLLSPLGDTSEEEIANAYQEQMEALLAGGVDLFMIETMSSLEETAIAVRMARKVSKLPVVAQLSFSVEEMCIRDRNRNDHFGIFCNF